jgi:ribosomal protein L7/L12
MEKEEILKMKNFVINAYADLFGCGVIEAKKIVEASTFMNVLETKPSFVMHYSDGYWAKEINKETKEKLIAIM